MDIKVLGPGCAKCKQTEKIVREAVAESGIDARVEKVEDIMKIAGYGVFGTPAVIIDGRVKSVGSVPEKEEVKAWLGKQLKNRTEEGWRIHFENQNHGLIRGAIQFFDVHRFFDTNDSCERFQ